MKTGNKTCMTVLLVVCLSLMGSTVFVAEGAEMDPNMTKWGPKLSEEELAEIAKLPKSELVEMLKTGDMVHAFEALKQLKAEAHGGLDENFDLLLNIAAETRGNIIVQGLIKPVEPTANIKEKQRVDKFLNFLTLQLQQKSPSVSPDQAISSIGHTVYLSRRTPLRRSPRKPPRRTSPERYLLKKVSPLQIDPNTVPIPPYGNDRVINILTQQLSKGNRMVRSDAVRWLGLVGANDVSKSEHIISILEAQITKEQTLNKTKDAKEAMTRHIQESIKKIRREVESRKYRKSPLNRLKNELK